MKTTRYFEEQVLRKRPYLLRAWCEAAIASPLFQEVQDDGRIRLWSIVRDIDGGRERASRIVLLADGETVHNAFFDRNFREGAR